MGFWSNLFASQGRDSGALMFAPSVTHLSGSEISGLVNSSNLTAAQLWSTQPHLRTVVTFLARNIAQLGLHTFTRQGETDRVRDRSSALALALDYVDGQMTTYDLVFALVGDLALYDRAYWYVGPTDEGGWVIRRVPPTRIEPVMADMWTVKEYRALLGGSGQYTTIPAHLILAFGGYHPLNPAGSSPTIDALRQTLQEQVEAARYRSQVWERGGRVSSVIERPSGAPEWSDAARTQFREDWYSKFTGRGPRAGGTPILEDGMKLTRIDFNAQEQQFVEAAKLSLTTVAAAFHVNPTMIGQNDGANYSNVREFRKMLYGDTLGPTIAQIEARINGHLVQRMGLDRAKTYVEFNIAEKLQGNFEEQTAAIQAATGAPWMTRNEARARVNMPAVAGGDELIVPLNVLVGGQASPADSGSQNRNTAPALSVKAAPDSDPLALALGRFFTRQRRAVLSAMGAKAGPSWWDAERWDAELGDDLFEVFVSLSDEAATAAIKAAGGDSAGFDIAALSAYLRAKADGVAGDVNAATLAALEAADADPAAVFDLAEGQRSAALAVGLGTAIAGFATVEAAKQTGGATKTWGTGSKPRDSHAAMAGETVAIEDNFSNGMRWPGDSGDAAEVANCLCTVAFDYP